MEFTVASICGHAKCGTTWLLHALSRHPGIVGLGECDFIRKLINNYPDLARTEQAIFSGSPWSGETARERKNGGAARSRVRGLARSDPDDLRKKPNRLRHFSPEEQRALRDGIVAGGTQREILLRFFGRIREWKASASIILGKAASQTAVVDTFKEWIPESRIIFIARDGRDAAVSFRNFDIVRKRKPQPIVHYARMWSEGMKQYLDVSRRHEICLLTYEELTTDFNGTMRRVLSFLQLESDTELLQDIEEGSSFERLSGRPRGEEDEKSILRKGVVGDWRNKFTPAEVKAFKKVAGEALVDMGYERDLDWSL